MVTPFFENVCVKNFGLPAKKIVALQSIVEAPALINYGNYLQLYYYP
jgi:hypothetical protein